MKKLFEFEVKRKQMVKESETTTDEKGQTVTITKDVEKDVPIKFFIRKPSRAMMDEADLFYAIQLSDAIKKGLLTRAQLSTKFVDEASALTENDRKKYVESFVKIYEKEQKYRELMQINEAERTEEQKKEIETLFKEMTELNKEILELEEQHNSLFNHTAETWARNHTVIWWVLHLGYNGDETPIFGEGKFEERLAKADAFEEADDTFMIKVYQKLSYLIGFWYSGRAEKPEDFEHWLKLVND